jgi:hypothetical protein
MRWDGKLATDALLDKPAKGIQILTVPKTAVYELCAKGAGSFNDKASGAVITGKIELDKGEKLYIGIGQQGNHTLSGSGGTFVAKNIGRVISGTLYRKSKTLENNSFLA